MTDRSRGGARNLPQGRDPSRHQKHSPRPQDNRHRPKSARRGPPHPRTHHELDPRKVAFETLRRVRPGDLLEPALMETLRHLGHGEAFAHRVLPMLEDATRLAILFDHLIAHVASRPALELDGDVRAALHLFLAWFLCGDSKAVYAHGNAAVDLLSDRHKGRGFVNACVRRLGEFLTVEAAPAEDYRGMIARHERIALWPDRARLGGGRVVRAERGLLPDPATNLAGHLSLACGLPRVLVDRLIEQYGEAGAIQACVAAVEHPATWVRPNPLAYTDDLALWWISRGVDVKTAPIEGAVDAIALPAGVNVTQHPAFERGAFYVQDYSAQLVAPALQPRPGQTLLDLCAAPGGKAGHLAELTRDGAKILACDLTEQKIARVQQNIARMGYRSVATVIADAATVRFPQPFDGVLVDAPCSNSGVLARRVEARHRISAESVAELGKLQLAILENAALNLKPGGVLVYSVCSVLMEEGVDIVHKFMGKGREDAGWEVEHENFLLPVPSWHDGGYLARLRAPEA
ncbi:MAG: methyltransferase domain-containing protein [Planctomycetes bacterium]|nr:methyltransferase domain-containing protein [Planctomycetota bacterium]